MSVATSVAVPPVASLTDRVLRRAFSFPVMVAGLLTTLAAIAVRARFDDPDMWWHLKMGKIIWTTHTIPVTDIFSYTTGHHAYIPHEWLSQALIYGAYRFGGYSGLMLWLCFFSAALLIAGYTLCSLYSGNAKVGFLGALVIFVFATSGLAVRPQMIGYLILIVELLLLHFGQTRNPRWFFCLPPLFAIWVNFHGSFFLGLGVAGIYLVCSFFNFRIGSLTATRWDSHRSRVLALAIVLSTAALFLNPVGLKLIRYPIDTFLHQTIGLSHVDEWLPLQMNGARGIALMATLGCIFLVVLIKRSELLLQELVVLAVGTWLAVSHQRMVFVFGILAAPILTRLLSSSWENYDAKRDRPMINAIFIAGSLAIAFWVFPNRTNLALQIETDSPVKAVEFMKTHHLTGHMLNDYGFGGYLIWAAPEYPVFIDGRGDVFEFSGVFGDFANWAMLQSDPNQLLNKYDVDFCVLARNSGMAHVLPLLPGWKTVYSDNVAIIFTRTPTAAK